MSTIRMSTIMTGMWEEAFNVNLCGSEGRNPDVFLDLKKPKYTLGAPATLSYSVTNTHALEEDPDMKVDHQF